MLKTDQGPFHTLKLISLDKHFDEMIKLYEADFFPKVLLLSGQKGIGKFTLTFHFLNYIYSKKEKTNYNTKDKLINSNSLFYKSILNKNCLDVIFIQAEESKNIKIDVIRNIKSMLSRSSLSDNPRFIIIDEVEFLNLNSANALLKMLEEPSKNNYFILINNQQTQLIETISSRCLKNNIFLNTVQRKKIIDNINKDKTDNILIDDTGLLTPGMLLRYSELSNKHKIEDITIFFLKLDKLLHTYKKEKDKTLISMSIYLVDKFFYDLVEENNDSIDFLFKLKSNIINKINDFTMYNLNINSVLNFIELKLKNVR